jgi:hypothetical protein
MKSRPITAKASPLKIEEEKSKKTTSKSTSYEADASGNLFKVERSASAGDILGSGKGVQGIDVPKAQSSSKKASNPDAYVSDLKKRFPNATGEDMVRGGYISSSYADRFPSSGKQSESSSSSSSSSSESESKTPVMRPAEAGNPGMTTDTRWNWQQKNINKTQQSQRRGNRGQARADMKFMESQGLVEKTGAGGRGQGYKLTEAGGANADAAKRYELNQADIFGVDQTRFTRDESGNISGRNESYNPQDSRKNRAQTGTYDARDTYKEAKPEEQWNTEKHGEYTGASNVSKSSSASEAKTEPILSSPVTPESNRESSESMFNVNPVGQTDNAFLRGMASGAGESMESNDNIGSEAPEPVLPEQNQILGEEGPLRMKYNHNPRMMYKDSPAKMWGAAKTEAGAKKDGVFDTIKHKTTGKPITKLSSSSSFVMKGFNKK